MSNDKRCDLDGCTRPIHARNLCHRCYGRRRREGRFGPPLRALSAARYADDVDETVVERLVAGEMVPFHSFERREAVRRLVGRGVPKLRVARMLGIDQRQVYRDLGAIA